jgi:hypothetical protein
VGGGAGARTERVGSVPERLEVLTDTALIQAKVDRVTIRDDAPRQPEVVSISVDRHISVVKSHNPRARDHPAKCAAHWLLTD